MKASVRNGVFETNSSSVHAIVINKKNLAENNNSIVKIECGDYGWEFEEYRSPFQKMNYLWTAIVDNNEDLDSWKEYLIEALGFPKNIIFVDEPKDVFNDVIDHAEELKEFLVRMKSDPVLLKKFIFGDSYIITSNDNDMSSDRLTEILDPNSDEFTGDIDNDDMYIYYKWN